MFVRNHSVTSVGATQLQKKHAAEIAASLSSGGFSNVFSRPTYQESAVTAYLTALGDTNNGKFNRTSRAFPDVSAVGIDLAVAFQNQFFTVDGTSCSTPIFASLIALINDNLTASGAPPLGFLNPFLYANPQAFTDITMGSNPGCNTSGFPALAGWDPVSNRLSANSRIFTEQSPAGHRSWISKLSCSSRSCACSCRPLGAANDLFISYRGDQHHYDVALE